MKNIVSLFDGMSCLQQALDRSNISFNNYYASEIDKFAIQVTQKNYPNTIQLGSVTDVNGHNFKDIFLLAGGSPCQSFSFAGKRKGMSTKCEIEITTLEQYLQLKKDGYEFEGQSYLFWEYVRILKEVKPKYFLLENVMMAEKWERIISNTLGVAPIMINSELVSAQNRKRLYWTNIGLAPGGLFGDLYSIIKQPKDKGILLKDILEKEVDEKYYLSEKIVSKIFEGSNLNGKNNTLRTTGHCSQSNKHNFDLIKIDKTGTIKDNQNKASCFTAGGHSGGNHSDMDLICVAMRGRNPENTSDRTTNCITSVQKDNLVMSNNSARIRRLTPIECERLQTVKDNYTDCVSDSQRYKMLGNGWTVDVVAYILNYI